MWLILVLHCVSIDTYFFILIPDQFIDFWLFIFWSECADNIVAFEFYFLTGEFVFILVVFEVLVELHSYSNSIFFQNLAWGQIRNEVDIVVSGRVENLIICSHIVEASPEHNRNFISSHSDGWTGTIKGGVSNP